MTTHRPSEPIALPARTRDNDQSGSGVRPASTARQVCVGVWSYRQERFCGPPHCHLRAQPGE